jgi:hypothetical protein
MRHRGRRCVEGEAGFGWDPAAGDWKCHTFRGPDSTVDNVVSRVQHGFPSSLSAGPPDVQALTSRFARACPTSGRESNVSSYLRHQWRWSQPSAGMGRPKRGISTRNAPAAVVIYDAGASKVPHNGSLTGSQAWIFDGDGLIGRLPCRSPTPGAGRSVGAVAHPGARFPTYSGQAEEALPERLQEVRTRYRKDRRT